MVEPVDPGEGGQLDVADVVPPGGLDSDPDRLRVAERLGATPLEGVPPRKVGAFPIVVDASGTEAGLRCALNSTAFDGLCTSTSVYLQDPAVPLFAMYSRCCTLHIGRAHVRPAVPSVLELVAAGFDLSLVTWPLWPGTTRPPLSPNRR